MAQTLDGYRNYSKDIADIRHQNLKMITLHLHHPPPRKPQSQVQGQTATYTTELSQSSNTTHNLARNRACRDPKACRATNTVKRSQ